MICLLPLLLLVLALARAFALALALALALRLLRASASALPPLPRLPLQGGIRASQPLALALAFLAL